MSLQNASCKTFNLFCPEQEPDPETIENINVNFFSSEQLQYPKRTFNRALCLSGGGARAFTMSITILRELELMGHINKFDTIGSVSGGTWANALFQYAKYQSRSEFLGDVYEPQNITQENINVLSKNCVRSCTDISIGRVIIREVDDIVKTLLDKEKISTLWKELIYYYSAPFSLNVNKFFSYNEDSILKELENQSELSREDFILPSEILPFPLFFSTIEGPESLEPFVSGTNLRANIFEMSPLYTGIYNPLSITYTNEDKTKEENIEIGNFSNSISFKGTLVENNISKVRERFLLLDAMSLSSYVIGGFINSLDLPDFFDKELYIETYFNKTENNELLFIDGCSVNNQGIIPMVQRNFETIVDCVNSDDKFNYFISDDYTIETLPLENTLASLFGINLTKNFFGKLNYDFTNAQIFKKENFYTLIEEMNNIEKKGDGIVCKIEVETIENKWYNIPGGRKHTLIIIYPSVPENWFNLLKPEIQSIVEKKNLPYIKTQLVGLNAESSNLMASMTSWTVNKYMDVIMS
jgi:hypothetical protein